MFFKRLVLLFLCFLLYISPFWLFPGTCTTVKSNLVCFKAGNNSPGLDFQIIQIVHVNFFGQHMQFLQYNKFWAASQKSEMLQLPTTKY